MSEQRKFVVGMDSSSEARAALQWAMLVAETDDYVSVVHAYASPIGYLPPSLATAPTMPAEDYHQLAKERLEHILGAVDDARITPWVVERRPGPAIVAEASDADLVVVGHRCDSQMSMMLGSTANYVLHHASCPVVVVRGIQPTPPRKVVVGVDHHHADASPNESVRALQWAYRLPGVEEIRVIHAWSLYPYAWDISGAVVNAASEFEAAAHRVIESVSESAGPPPADAHVRFEVVEGLPAKSLVDASNGADLVVVGTRGRGGFRELLLGSTSTEVAAHSHVPVAVIR